MADVPGLAAREYLDQSPGDVFDIVASFSKIAILDARVRVEQAIGNFPYRPFGIRAIVANKALDLLAKTTVLKHEQVRIENVCVVITQGFTKALLRVLELLLRKTNRGAEPFDLRVLLALREIHPHDAATRVVDEKSCTDGHTR